MNGFTQHIPGFVSVETPPQRVPFKTTEDLLNIDTVVRFSKDPKFSHFAISDNCLMAIYDEGRKWWVVGYLDDSETVLLPQLGVSK